MASRQFLQTIKQTHFSLSCKPSFYPLFKYYSTTTNSTLPPTNKETSKTSVAESEKKKNDREKKIRENFFKMLAEDKEMRAHLKSLVMEEVPEHELKKMGIDYAKPTEEELAKAREEEKDQIEKIKQELEKQDLANKSLDDSLKRGLNDIGESPFLRPDSGEMSEAEKKLFEGMDLSNAELQYKLAQENATENRRKTLSYYKQILKLMAQLLNVKTKPLLENYSYKMTHRLIKAEFIMNKFSQNQEEIETSFNEAEKYISRLKTEVKSKQISQQKSTPSSTTTTTKPQQRQYNTAQIEEYWNHYYQQPDAIDEWYFDYEGLEKYIPTLHDQMTALVLGGGLSSLSSRLVEKCKLVYDIDISSFSVDYMDKLYKQVKGIRFMKMDARRMYFSPNMFDIIFDKGTFDTIMTEETGEQDVQDLENHLWKVLKNNGIYLLVSATPLEGIEAIFSSYSWKIELVGKESITQIEEEGEDDGTEEEEEHADSNEEEKNVSTKTSTEANQKEPTPATDEEAKEAEEKLKEVEAVFEELEQQMKKQELDKEDEDLQNLAVHIYRITALKTLPSNQK